MAAYRGRRGGLDECSMIEAGRRVFSGCCEIAARTLADGNDQLL